jgi:hypothetical protein
MTSFNQKLESWWELHPSILRNIRCSEIENYKLLRNAASPILKEIMAWMNSPHFSNDEVEPSGVFHLQDINHYQEVGVK